MSTRAPGYRFSHHVPPGPAFFSMIVNGSPASSRRMPASSPASPQPITTTCASSRTSAGISSPHVIAPASAPSRCRSSTNIGTTSSATSPHARNDIISWTSSVDGGGRQHAAAVAVLEDRGQRPPPRLGLLLVGHVALVLVEQRECGRRSPRTHAGSPVMCTIEHISAGMLTSSSAAAMVASSSVNGRPACGLRSESGMGTRLRAPTATVATSASRRDRWTEIVGRRSVVRFRGRCSRRVRWCNGTVGRGVLPAPATLRLGGSLRVRSGAALGS